MPIAATTQAARPTTMVDHRADARDHARMAARPTSAHSAALEAWICALLLALLGHIEPLRQFFPNQAGYELPDDEEAAFRLIRHAIRAENRLRARVAWLVRQHPNRGMRRRFGRLTPELRAKSARAPPRAGPHPSKSASKTPLPAAMTHARIAAASKACRYPFWAFQNTGTGPRSSPVTLPRHAVACMYCPSGT